jgi:hypothetical protein
MEETVAGEQFAANPERHWLWIVCATVDKYSIKS